MSLKTYFNGVKFIIVFTLLVIVFKVFLEPSYRSFKKKKTIFSTSYVPMTQDFLPKITIYRQPADTDKDCAKSYETSTVKCLGLRKLQC